MIITDIFIKNFGSIEHYAARLAPQWNILSGVGELAQALDVLLCRPAGPDPHFLRDDTQIAATISLADRVYTAKAGCREGAWKLNVTDDAGKDATALYRYAITESPEQNNLSFFDGSDRSLPQRLCRYRHRENIEKNQAFQAHLRRYIGQFQPEQIHNRKNYWTKPDRYGQFRAYHPDLPGDIALSETEERLFLYICFLNLAEFWQDFEAMRNIHHAKKPLIVQNFLEYLDEDTDLSRLKSRTEQLRRQVILFTK